MKGPRRIILADGKTATAQGAAGYGFDDVSRNREASGPAGDLWDTARAIGLSDPSQPLGHRVVMDAKGAASGAKKDPKIRVFVEKGSGRLLGSEEIESDPERKPIPLTSYRSSFTEEVFSGIAAPHINQSAMCFAAYRPDEWDIGAFSFAMLNENLTSLRVPEPMSVFQIIDDAEGNDTTQSQFYAGSGTLNAPLRAVAKQESEGTICVSMAVEFESDQAGLTALLNILETSAGFKEGPNASTRIVFNGIRWAGMLQYDNAKLYANWNGTNSGVQVEMSQPLDPRIIQGNWSSVKFRMNAVFFQEQGSVGAWRFSITRDTKT